MAQDLSNKVQGRGIFLPRLDIQFLLKSNNDYKNNRFEI